MSDESSLFKHENVIPGILVPPFAYITSIRDVERRYEDLIREYEQKYQNERDRRYTEVKNAEEKALRIKEQADRDALNLARDIQTYKDEKANELRSQIERERGTYATQSDLLAMSEKIAAQIKPISDFVTSQQGGTTKSKDIVLYLVSAVSVICLIITIITK